MPSDLSTAEEHATKTAWAILAAMGFGALIAQMFSTVIGPALPTIKADLSLGLSAQTWTVTAYSLAFGAALVAGGRLGDLVGEVKMIVIGFAIFGVGLVVAAIALDAPMLISGRTVQGIGIGISAPATLSIVVNSFPIRQRGFAVGVWGFAHGIGMLVGPLFAAWMMQLASWRWVFWVSVPLTVLVIIVTVAATREYRSVLAHGRYDWLGLLLGGAGISLIALGLQNSSDSWSAPGTWGNLAVGAVFLAAFGVAEIRIADPLVDFGLWRERLFSGGFFAECAVGFVYIPFLTFIGSLFFISVLHYSPGKASWVIVITTGVCMVFEPISGRWTDIVGPGIPITTALLIQATALAWIGLTFNPDTTLTQLIAPLTLMGIGAGLSLPACNTSGMLAVDSERAGMGSGLMQMTFNIPAALGIALVTSIIGGLTTSGVTDHLRDRPELSGLAADYANDIQIGELRKADEILAALPPESAAVIKQAAENATSSATATSILVLAGVAFAGAVFSWVVIGRRRVPEHIEMTHAAHV
jgi:EmrB/QacA subfamily drug resistance transporter